MLSDLVLELRSRRLDPEPVDEQLRERAAAAVEQVSRRAGVAAPAVLVVPLLGRPFPGQQRRSVGTGGLAVTRFTPGQPISIVFARAALTEVSRRALDHLVAHELGHVIRYRTRIGRVRHYAWSIGFLAVTLPMAAWVVATQSGALLAATATVALGYMVLRAVWQRREEGEADLFAIALTVDLNGCAELMTFYEQNMRDEPLPDGRLRRGLAIIDRRWLATHPEPHQRLQVMRDHLARKT
jgi:Zn-dependent protease with chaperone function